MIQQPGKWDRADREHKAQDGAHGLGSHLSRQRIRNGAHKKKRKGHEQGPAHPGPIVLISTLPLNSHAAYGAIPAVRTVIFLFSGQSFFIYICRELEGLVTRIITVS